MDKGGFGVHVAGIAWINSSQSREEVTTGCLPCCHLIVHRLLPKKTRPVGCLKCAMELILTWLERFICMLCSTAVFPLSICLEVNALLFFLTILFCHDENWSLVHL